MAFWSRIFDLAYEQFAAAAADQERQLYCRLNAAAFALMTLSGMFLATFKDEVPLPSWELAVTVVTVLLIISPFSSKTFAIIFGFAFCRVLFTHIFPFLRMYLLLIPIRKASRLRLESISESDFLSNISNIMNNTSASTCTSAYSSEEVFINDGSSTYTFSGSSITIESWGMFVVFAISSPPVAALFRKFSRSPFLSMLVRSGMTFVLLVWLAKFTELPSIRVVRALLLFLMQFVICCVVETPLENYVLAALAKVEHVVVDFLNLPANIDVSVRLIVSFIRCQRDLPGAGLALFFLLLRVGPAAVACFFSWEFFVSGNVTSENMSFFFAVSGFFAANIAFELFRAHSLLSAVVNELFIHGESVKRSLALNYIACIDIFSGNIAAFVDTDLSLAVAAVMWKVAAVIWKVVDTVHTFANPVVTYCSNFSQRLIPWRPRIAHARNLQQQNQPQQPQQDQVHRQPQQAQAQQAQAQQQPEQPQEPRNPPAAPPPIQPLSAEDAEQVNAINTEFDRQPPEIISFEQMMQMDNLVVILVCGMVNSGKSSLVKLLMNIPWCHDTLTRVSDTAGATVTETIFKYPMREGSPHQVVLIDSPGTGLASDPTNPGEQRAQRQRLETIRNRCFKCFTLCVVKSGTISEEIKSSLLEFQAISARGHLAFLYNFEDRQTQLRGWNQQKRDFCKRNLQWFHAVPDPTEEQIDQEIAKTLFANLDGFDPLMNVEYAEELSARLLDDRNSCKTFVDNYLNQYGEDIARQRQQQAEQDLITKAQRKAGAWAVAKGLVSAVFVRVGGEAAKQTGAEVAREISTRAFGSQIGSQIGRQIVRNTGVQTVTRTGFQVAKQLKFGVPVALEVGSLLYNVVDTEKRRQRGEISNSDARKNHCKDAGAALLGVGCLVVPGVGLGLAAGVVVSVAYRRFFPSK